jgi:hypothetical protein
MLPDTFSVEARLLDKTGVVFSHLVFLVQDNILQLRYVVGGLPHCQSRVEC